MGLVYLQSHVSLGYGIIPVDPSDDADDGGGNSEPSESVRTTDPMSHTPVKTKSTTSEVGCHLTKIQW